MANSPTDNDLVVPRTRPTWVTSAIALPTRISATWRPRALSLGLMSAAPRRTRPTSILQTLMPNAPMPKNDPPPAPPRQKWSANRSLNFKTWILHKYPLGAATAPSAPPVAPTELASGVRLRKNVNSLSSGRDRRRSRPRSRDHRARYSGPTTPTAISTLPVSTAMPASLQHHVDPFNSWHQGLHRPCWTRSHTPGLRGRHPALLGHHRDDGPRLVLPAALRQLHRYREHQRPELPRSRTRPSSQRRRPHHRRSMPAMG